MKPGPTVAAFIGSATLLLLGCREEIPPEPDARATTTPTTTPYTQTEGPYGTITALAFCGDDSQLFSGAGPFMPGVQAYPVRRWSTEVMQEIGLLEGHKKAVCSLDVSVDCRLLVSGSSDRTVRVWDLASNCQLAELQGHSDESGILYSISVQFTPSGSVVSAGGEGGGTVILWNWQDASVLKRIPSPGWIECTSLSQDGRHLALGGWKGAASRKQPFLGVCDLETGEIAHQFQMVDGDDFFLSIALLQKEQLILTGSNKGRVGWFTAEEGRPLRSVDAHKGRIEAVLLLGEASFITAGTDGWIRRWSTTTGDLLWSHDSGKPITSAAICNEPGLLAVGGRDGGIRIWRLDDLGAAAEHGRVKWMDLEEGAGRTPG